MLPFRVLPRHHLSLWARKSNNFSSSSTSEYALHKQLLESLGLAEVNPGVFNGKWSKGGGELVHSINPATNNIIASVQTGSPKNLKDTLDLIREVKPMWKSVGLLYHTFSRSQRTSTPTMLSRCLLRKEEKLCAK